MLTVIRNARVLTLDGDDTQYDRADIIVRDGLIWTIGPGAAESVADQDARIIEAGGLLAMPGLVNGHYHSPANFMKGALRNWPLELFMLYEVPPLMDQPVSPRFAYVRTMLGAMEMLKQGVTSVHDDCFFVPTVTDEEITSVMSAYGDAGLRATVTLDQPNVIEYTKYPFLFDILPPEIRARMENVPLMSDDALLGFYHRFIDTWHGESDGRLRCAVSCSAPQRVTPSYFSALGQLAQQCDIPYNMHILETRLQRVLGREVYGKSLIRYAHEMGVLNEQAMVIHSVWVDEADIALMSESGCSIAHNPVSNLKLGSGVMPFRRLRDKGINICIGNDEAAADDGINLWTVGKIAGLVHNVSDHEFRDWPLPDEILSALTTSGAQAMRLPVPTGQLKSGWQADIILLDLDSYSFTPLNDLKRQLVYCETGSSVKTVMVAGKIVVENRRLLTVDEDAMKAEARALAGEFADYMARCKVGADELKPYYRQMYERAVQTPIDLNTTFGRSPG